MIGIYSITSRATKANSKSYIGRSLDIATRFYIHKRALEMGKHICKEMQKDYNSFSDDFKFDIVEKCKEEELDKREQYWIKKFKTVETGYNTVMPTLAEKDRNKKRKVLYLDEEFYDKLQKIANSECRTMSNLIIKLLIEYERNL